jgi:hypothetical protein
VKRVALELLSPALSALERMIDSIAPGAPIDAAGND